jgi:hypothetical protein
MIGSDKDPLLSGSTVVNVETSDNVTTAGKEEPVDVEIADRRGATSIHLSMELRALLVVSSIAQDAASTALSLYMIDDLSFEPIQLTQYWMYMGWSYTFSPAIGMLADVMVIGGEKRRPLIAFGALGSMSIFILFISVPITTQVFPLFVVISFIHNICGACVASATNGAIVAMFSRTIETLYPDLATTASTRTGSIQDGNAPDDDEDDHLGEEKPKTGKHQREQEKEALRVGLMARVQSEAMLYRSGGSLISSILFTVMVIWCSLYTMLGVSAILFASILPTLSFLRSREHGLLGETSGHCCSTLGTTVSDMVSRVRASTHFSLNKLDRGVFGLLLVLVFVLVYTGVPDAGSVYFAYVGTQFMFPSWLLSLNMCLGTLGGTLSCYLFMHFQGKQQQQKEANPTRKVRAITPFTIFAFGSVCAAVGYVTNFMVATGFVVDTLHIPANVFIPFDNFMTSFFSRLAFLPILAVAAERCPVGYEAAFFEVFSALSIAGGTLSALLTTHIAERLSITSDNYSNVWILLLVCAGGKLLPILAAAILPIQKGGAKLKPLFGAQPIKPDSGSGAIVE